VSAINSVVKRGKPSVCMLSGPPPYCLPKAPEGRFARVPESFNSSGCGSASCARRRRRAGRGARQAAARRQAALGRICVRLQLPAPVIRVLALTKPADPVRRPLPLVGALVGCGHPRDEALRRTCGCSSSRARVSAATGSGVRSTRSGSWAQVRRTDGGPIAAASSTRPGPTTLWLTSPRRGSNAQGEPPRDQLRAWRPVIRASVAVAACLAAVSAACWPDPDMSSSISMAWP
jgi:hypothetical protein